MPAQATDAPAQIPAGTAGSIEMQAVVLREPGRPVAVETVRLASPTMRFRAFARVFGRAGEPEAPAGDDILPKVESMELPFCRSLPLVDKCENDLHALRDAGKLPADASQVLDAVIAKARRGEWQRGRRYSVVVQTVDALRPTAADALAHRATPSLQERRGQRQSPQGELNLARCAHAPSAG